MLEQALGSEAKGLGDEELLTLAGANSLLCPGPPLQWIWCFCWVGSFASKSFKMASCESTFQTFPGKLPSLSPALPPVRLRGAFRGNCLATATRTMCFCVLATPSAALLVMLLKKKPTFFPSCDCGGVACANVALVNPCLPARCWDRALVCRGLVA